MALTTACQSSPETTRSREVPGPVGDVFVTAGGQQIELVNLPTDGIRLLEWSFSRFREAELDEPEVYRIRFGDQTPGCGSRAGWTDLSDRGVEIAICISNDRYCTNGAGSPLRNSVKFCALHELAHGWLIAHASQKIRSAFLDHTGLDAWAATEETPWHKRGVEYAAEVVAWGLMDRPLDLVRIESPPCEHLEAGFRILTNARSLVRCGVLDEDGLREQEGGLKTLDGRVEERPSAGGRPGSLGHRSIEQVGNRSRHHQEEAELQPSGTDGQRRRTGQDHPEKVTTRAAHPGNVRTADRRPDGPPEFAGVRT